MEVYLPALDKTVNVRGLKVKEIDSIADKRQLMSGDAIEKMLQDCLTDSEVKAGELLSGDRNALFMGVRRATYGDEYDFSLKCPTCGHSAMYGISLASIPVIKGDRDLVNKRMEDKTFLAPFKFKECGKTAHWRFKDASDMKKGLAIQKNKAESQISQSMLLLIQKVDGLEEGVPLKRFIEELGAGDAQDFVDYYKTVEPGLDDEIELICESGLCGTEMKVTMPFDPVNFFKRSVRTKRYSTASFTSSLNQE